MIIATGRRQSGKNTLFDYVKQLVPESQDFSFAHHLKRMAVDILGLREEQAFGNDDQKNTLVEHLLWENFPVARLGGQRRYCARDPYGFRPPWWDHNRGIVIQDFSYSC
jgi:hypothetical protein